MLVDVTRAVGPVPVATGAADAGSLVVRDRAPARVSDIGRQAAWQARALARLIWTDAARTIAAHGRVGGQSRLAALARGRAELARIRREHTPAVAVRDASTAVWAGRRLAAVAATAGLLAATGLLAPRWATEIGRTLVVPNPWLAGLFDRLGDIWGDQPLAVRIAYTLAYRPAARLRLPRRTRRDPQPGHHQGDLRPH